MTNLAALARAFGNPVACCSLFFFLFLPLQATDRFFVAPSFFRCRLLPGTRAKSVILEDKRQIISKVLGQRAKRYCFTGGSYSSYRFPRARLFEWYRSHRGAGEGGDSGSGGGDGGDGREERGRSDIFVRIDKDEKAGRTRRTERAAEFQIEEIRI